MGELAIGTRIGPYIVNQILPGQRGGFAQLVLGQMPAAAPDAPPVAIKIARTDEVEHGDPETFNRALGSEVETLRHLKHPSIVRPYPIQIADRRYSYLARATNLAHNPWYYVMEYLTGGSLDDLMQRRKVLDLPLAVEIAYQVAEALDYMHACGYAHLDIKNNNILFRQKPDETSRPQAVLIDFGAAQKELRRAEVEAGALVYLPPERVDVLLGHTEPTTFVNKSAADVYALGVTLYCMVTGELPFKGQRDTISTAILTLTPVRPVELNPRLSQYPEIDVLVMQMLEKRPDRRPTMKDVLTRLDQILPSPRLIQRPKKRDAALVPAGWRRAAIALALVVALQAVLALTLWPRGEPLGITRPGIATREIRSPTEASPPTAAATRVPTQAPRATEGGGLIISTPGNGAAEPTAVQAGDAVEPTLVPTYTPKPTALPPTATPVPVTPNP